ncbi:YfiR family protein [Candidatus Marimicrobium litorale]|uniref:YfiR family protein n=1 Tax=Candidatus Marimicrobium litorale TaxID=2518991 RepID=A0ABT3T988_9GAMM|nr:YfiR family protein [Candidatus Marimicrobium litorale]MCX2978846.1 YfiR family protein [Candidatus Marimicrobium litorale]
MSWICRISCAAVAVLFFVLFVSSRPAYAASNQDTLSKENKLKAAYFLNFIEFINWPNDSQNSPAALLYICLQDEAPFEEFFSALVDNRRAKGSKPELKIQRLSEANHCDYTYLHQPLAEEDLKMKGNIVVLASDQISQQDAAITFFITNRKLRFEIDLDTMQKNQVTVSSELLKLAKIK